ncbi:MAG: invasion associated locus B family protein [Alphaproteobacteria bacterium]|nr:invasion associated locus B family protein [Alphaproteobacteria bacterium]
MKHLLFAFLLMIATAASLPARAGEPRLVGTYGNWSAYVFREGSDKVCYMAAKPKKSEGGYNKRGEVFALLTHRPGEGTRDVFSYITGYTFKEKSAATVRINNEEFPLFTQGDTAWTPDAATDRKLTQALREGSDMTVTGTSSRGTETIDIFSLSGSSAAYKKISGECS